MQMDTASQSKKDIFSLSRPCLVPSMTMVGHVPPISLAFGALRVVLSLSNLEKSSTPANSKDANEQKSE